MSNYLRYFITILLLASLFYTYTIKIEQATIKNALDKKLPMIMDKKGFLITLNTIELINISNNIIESEVNSSFQISQSNKLAKFLPKKSLHFTAHSKTIPS